MENQLAPPAVRAVYLRFAVRALDEVLSHVASRRSKRIEFASDLADLVHNLPYLLSNWPDFDRIRFWRFVMSEGRRFRKLDRQDSAEFVAGWRHDSWQRVFSKRHPFERIAAKAGRILNISGNWQEHQASDLDTTVVYLLNLLQRVLVMIRNLTSGGDVTYSSLVEALTRAAKMICAGILAPTTFDETRFRMDLEYIRQELSPPLLEIWDSIF
jgi:hypothetical protein